MLANNATIGVGHNRVVNEAFIMTGQLRSSRAFLTGAHQARLPDPNP
ncbi:MAG: hypothetical protein WA702_21110 [Bradyrhizobium sp.]|jgi:hypothetical protein